MGVLSLHRVSGRFHMDRCEGFQNVSRKRKDRRSGLLRSCYVRDLRNVTTDVRRRETFERLVERVLSVASPRYGWDIFDRLSLSNGNLLREALI